MDEVDVAPMLADPVTVVAIPVKDEEERIGACLTAIGRQTWPPDAVLLLLNNCTDGTAAVARALAPDLGFGLEIVELELPPDQANAGHARAIAMDLAAERAGVQGVIMTTDADAAVPPDWIWRNLAGLRAGADLVCGRAVIDPVEAALIPAHLHADDALECQLIELLDAMAWQIDPDTWDPPPRHVEASGASLAVRVDAFRRAGGIPRIPASEDRAFAAAMRRIDARIRHDPDIKVVVSGRIVGRAPSGMADAIRRRMQCQDEFTDDQVEPAEHALRRLMLRWRVRLARAVVERAEDQLEAPLVDALPVCAGEAEVEDTAAPRHPVDDLSLAADLGLDPAELADLLARPHFGEAWQQIEARCPVLRRQRVRFIDLPQEIEIASRLLDQLGSPGLPGVC